jgi:hypothetical protein
MIQELSVSDHPFFRRLCPSPWVHRGSPERAIRLVSSSGVHVRGHVSTTVVSTSLAEQAGLDRLTLQFSSEEVCVSPNPLVRKPCASGHARKPASIVYKDVTESSGLPTR